MRIFGNRKATEDSVKTILEAMDGVSPQSIIIEDGVIRVVIEVEAKNATPALERDIQKRLSGFSRIKDVQVIMTADKPVPAKKTPAKAPSAGIELPIKHIIAVASGKGGVGKSTVAINLAAALAAEGLNVGVLDGDIYGPSLPRMTGTVGQKPEQEDGKIIPVSAHGLRLMSIGYMVAEEAPLIWRGPMIQSALKQLLADVDWSGCDVLVIDLPPGTGDAQLTLAQQVNLSGAVIVSTPQDIALIDARKGLEMFRKVNVPILGVVENMSYFCCAECGARNDVFGHGGARAEAEKSGVAFLGEVPLHARIREQADAGVPIVVAEPDGAQAAAYIKIAQSVRAKLKSAQLKSPADI